ncbi:MAG: DUF1727 domain-containing protein [Mycobacteriales bacterium]
MLVRALVPPARLLGRLSRLAGAGVGDTLPGRAVLFAAPDALGRLSEGRTVALVSGTNGKTTTTKLLAVATATSGVSVLSNASGSNLARGLVSALLPGPRGATAVLEVDEVALPDAIARCRPRLVVLLNLSRDQLDRTSEVTWHVTRWGRALTGSDAVVVANADDPLVVAAVRTARPDDDRVVWVASGQPWRADAVTCPSCGSGWDLPAEQQSWACGACGWRRPVPDWVLDDHVLHGPDGGSVPVQLLLPGRANASNAAMAAVAGTVLGVGLEDGLRAMAEVAEVAGRYLQRRDGDRQLRLLLAKNPAGWLEALEQIARDETRVLLALNARPVDGIDPSWIWDVPFEQLAGREVVVTGERAADLAVRLHYAGVGHQLVPGLEAAVAGLPAGHCDLVANYTAFVEARQLLTRSRS